MKKALKRIGAALLVALAVFLVPTIWFKPWSIRHFYARALFEFLIESPQGLSELRLLEPIGLDFYSNDLNDYSLAAVERAHRGVTRNIEILQSYGRDGGTPAGLDSMDVLHFSLSQRQRELGRWRLHRYRIEQMSGIHVGLPEFMTNTHQIRDIGDAEDFIERTSKFGVAFDQVIAVARRQAKEGITPPRFILAKVKTDVDGMIAKGLADNPLKRHFDTKVAALKADAEEVAALKKQLEGVIVEVVIPAYRRYLAAVQELAAKANDDAGVWKLPGGAAYYAHKLKSSTTTDMSAGEIHALGLAQVKRIEEEVRAILDAQGFQHVPIAEAFKKLSEDPRFLYPDTVEGRQQVLADYQKIIDEIETKTDAIFGMRPKIGIKVAAVPAFKQETASTGYYDPPPFDRSQPGTFFANLRDIKSHPRFAMRTLAYHEAIPGHHFQIALAQEFKHLPFFRRLINFPAYSEGWALYAELLAAEQGFQQGPFDRLGYLKAALWRAARLVVDTGIHSQKWTREQAIDYLASTTGMPDSEVVAEVERYIVWPGQACAYMVGRLKFEELRQRARDQLGERFSLKNFHDLVLSAGGVPLTLLERRVDEWIRSDKSRSAGRTSEQLTRQ